MKPTTYQPFDAVSVPLHDVNLIEASAGTGKTYSIAIMVLRLVVEQAIPIQEILMVTFTKAAVAELEERIRQFVMQAYKASQGHKISDSTITKVVDNAKIKLGEDHVTEALRAAALTLDETNVLTIHSFCQQVLNEFAFETEQLFGAELLQDSSAVLENAVNNYWRGHVTNLPLNVLTQVPALTRDAITAMVKDHMDGKNFYAFDEAEDYKLDESRTGQWRVEAEALQKKLNDLEIQLFQYTVDNWTEIERVTLANANARKNMDLSAPEAFLDKLRSNKNPPKYFNIYPDVIEFVNKITDANEEIKRANQLVLEYIFCSACKQIPDEVKKEKINNNQLSFDDLISNLHQSLVVKKNEKLRVLLQQKYKAVFIDEFQDTDRQQYEIFEYAFSRNCIVFYIGDPKQSIYAWRKADMVTYFSARRTVKHVYSMNENFRSAAATIEAMNSFLLPRSDFDTFYFEEAEERISYQNVRAPVPSMVGDLFYKGKPATPISIIEAKNKAEVSNSAALVIAHLLSDKDFTILKNDVVRPVVMADIGVLVRKKKEAVAIKNALQIYGIPAVTVNDMKVMQTQEAEDFLALITAFADPTASNLNKALFSTFLPFGPEDVRRLDKDIILEKFRKYKSIWTEQGLYAAATRFLADFDVRRQLLEHVQGAQDRTITNLYQLIELLAKKEKLGGYAPLELIQWLSRQMATGGDGGDEHLQRVESDEQAIKILTIHNSKGLQFNIVLAPFLDLSSAFFKGVASFRDDARDMYISVPKESLTEEMKKIYTRFLEQENRRLIYVAVTRAVYKVYLIENIWRNNKVSSLKAFTSEIEEHSSALIAYEPSPVLPENFKYNDDLKKVVLPVPAISNFDIKEKYWRRLSYTGMKGSLPVVTTYNRKAAEGDYDKFIFEELPKGAQTGDFLHTLFDRISFSENGRWEAAIDFAASKNWPPAREEDAKAMMLMLLDHVTKAEIIFSDSKGFSLSAIPDAKRVAELEFNFPVSLFSVQQLSFVLAESGIPASFKDNYDLEGLMNGFIDLFFEHSGKYYILDWKSNFLGSNNVTNYDEQSLKAAMDDNNYHLQYIIYVVALKKYLTSRISDFDYEKHFGGVVYGFVRGMRAAKSAGVFTTRPKLSLIKKIEDILSGIHVPA